jgi:lipopolysaccharide assembly outer membrane protein LptD (OstA)
MKLQSLLAGILLTAATLLSAATENPKMELRADSMTQSDSITVAKGSAVAIVGDVEIRAAQINFNRETGLLTCVGQTTIRTPEVTLKAVDAVIETHGGSPLIRANDIREER